MNTQICLLSGELMPNVIGVLHERPDAVVPVVTQESLPQVERLEASLRAANCPSTIMEPVMVLPYDLEDCVQSIEKVCRSGGETTINWTGGTKIMSYAARVVAEGPLEKLRAIYVNTAGRQLLVEDVPRSRVARAEILDSATLGLNSLVHILAAGHTVEGSETLSAFREAHTPAAELIAAAEAIVDARESEWNDLFKLSAAENAPYRPRYIAPQFLKILQAAKIVEPASQAGSFFLGSESITIPFHRSSPQAENSKFIRGGYLEIFLCSQLKDRGAFDDVAWHVTLNAGQQGRGTEFDVTVASEGRFLIIESKGLVDLHRLADMIEEQYARTRRVGRLFGRWMLYIHQFKAMYQSSAEQGIIASQEVRAQDYGGQLAWRDDLADFPNLVTEYLQEIKPPL